MHNLSLVSSVGFTIVGLLDVALFNAFMSSLLQAKAADLYRTKGVLAFANQGINLSLNSCISSVDNLWIAIKCNDVNVIFPKYCSSFKLSFNHKLYLNR